jgi:hypothetical protein
VQGRKIQSFLHSDEIKNYYRKPSISSSILSGKSRKKSFNIVVLDSSNSGSTSKNAAALESKKDKPLNITTTALDKKQKNKFNIEYVDNGTSKSEKFLPPNAATTFSKGVDNEISEILPSSSKEQVSKSFDENTKTPLLSNETKTTGHAPNPRSRGWKFIPVSCDISSLDLESLESSCITNLSIIDILHFSHYAEIAYFIFDSFELLRSDLVIYASKKNDFFHIPYIVSYDHEWKAIVISMRGTFSAIDVLVDLNIDLEPLIPDSTLLLAHSGNIYS